MMSGTGYLTRFEDYYKSSDESGDESYEDKVEYGNEKYGPNVEKLVSEVGEFEESGDEDRMADDGMVDNKADSDWTPEERDWVPQSLVDLKLKIKLPKNFKGYDEDAFNDLDDDVSEDKGTRVYSNDYTDVCKFKCVVCGLEIDTEKLKSHMNSNHDPTNSVGDMEVGDTKKSYDVKTWHRCGICGKAIVFTRVRLRYHVITEHSMAIQDYNEEHMVKRGNRVGRPAVAVGRGRRPSGVGSEDGDGDVDPRNVRQEDLSNDYADIVKVECRICSKQLEKDNFRFMHLKKHGMDLSDYKLVYGDPAMVKSSFHKCQICDQIFVFTRSRLASHLARHKVSVKEYGRKYLTKVKSDRSYTTNLQVGEIDKDCMFSNDYEDECSTICKICERSLNYGNLGSHLYQAHSTRMKDYVEQWGEQQITKKSYHECAICHETLLFIRYHLVTHVKTKHSMSISAYNKAHMQLHNVEYCDSNILDKGRKIGTQKAPQWCDGTMYKCPYCFNIYYRYFTFRIHLINSHKMTDTEERSTCVRENEILTDIYRCKICSTQVKRDRMDIEAHLKQAHKTTLKIYSANFENPNCTDDPKEIVARLVRMGVLEEPSDRMCKTPKKLKMRSSEMKSLNVKQVIKKEKSNPTPVIHPLIERSKTVQPSQGYKIPSQSSKASAAITSDNKVAKSSEKFPPDGHTTEFSSPIKKIKIPKIKREVPEVKSEVNKEQSNENGFDKIRKDLERDILTDSTDTENESYSSSKRKRKLPSKFSEDFEVTLNKSNTPQRPKPVTSSVSPKKSKFSHSSSSTASPLSQRQPSNTPKSRKNSNWISPHPSPARKSTVGGVTQLQRLSSESGSGGMSSPGKGGGDTSAGGVSSPGRFGPIKLEKTSPRTDEDSVVYKCPLRPCTWTCGKEGMRQGPAVLHLLRVHKIQPLEMRERGIKFDKIQT